MHFLALGLWIGLLTGFAEVLVLILKLYVIGEFLTLTRHAVWMAPLVDGILCTPTPAAMSSDAAR